MERAVLSGRMIPLSRTKELGVYLSFVSLYQLLYFVVFLLRFELFGGLLGRVDFSHFDEQTRTFQHIKGPADDLTMQILFAFHPRLGLELIGSVLSDVLQIYKELPSPWLFGISFLLELTFTIFLIRGRQPLKTYLTFEALFGGPNVLLLFFGVLFSVDNQGMMISSWAWFAAVIVLVFISVAPCIWAIRLLWSGSQRRRAGVEAA